ncbi:MAG: hypothetical protein AB8H79_04835 [Myxococcota bacterium]
MVRIWSLIAVSCLGCAPGALIPEDSTEVDNPVMPDVTDVVLQTENHGVHGVQLSSGELWDGFPAEFDNGPHPDPIDVYVYTGFTRRGTIGFLWALNGSEICRLNGDFEDIEAVWASDAPCQVVDDLELGFKLNPPPSDEAIAMSQLRGYRLTDANGQVYAAFLESTMVGEPFSSVFTLQMSVVPLD